MQGSRSSYLSIVTVLLWVGVIGVQTIHSETGGGAVGTDHNPKFSATPPQRLVLEKVSASELNNRFVAQPLTKAEFHEDAHYTLINRASGKALDVENRGVENDAPLTVTEPSDALHQLWRTEDEGGKYYLVNGYTDKVVQDNSGRVAQVRDQSSSAHTWIIKHVEEAYFSLVNERSENALAVSGEAVVTQSYTGAENQLWRILTVTAEPEEPKFELEGFATVGEGTTGGAGGKTVTVSSAKDLIDYIQRPEPYIILIKGAIDLPEGDLDYMWDIAPNKTLFGVEDARITSGGFRIKGTRNNGEGEVTRTNVIIRNITFSNSNDDCVNISQGARNVWIDHNTFSDSYDGLVDVKREASFVTVSWNEFYNHKKTMLCGHDESHSYDRGYLKVSYHHNYFHETHSRHPRIRYGRVHVYNNYYTNIEGYVIGAGIESSAISENNHVWISNRFTDWYDETGVVTDRNKNSLLGHVGHDLNPEVNRVKPDWSPDEFYTYTLNSPLNVKKMVTGNAGAGNIDITALNSFIRRAPFQHKPNGIITIQEDGVLSCALNLESALKIQVSFLNANGRLVKRETFLGQAGKHRYTFGNIELRSGLYSVSITGGLEEITRERISIIR